MEPDPRFVNQPKSFWANVRLVSQEAGYTDRGTKMVLIPTVAQVGAALRKVGLLQDHLFDESGAPNETGELLLEYFEFRATALNDYVEPRLMDGDRAEAVFKEYKARLRPSAPLPMNKQKGVKKAPAFFTGLINMLIEQAIGTWPCDYDPKKLTTVTRDDAPLRTLARRVDGAFPSTVNPIALWEIKEYYYTTTFGSRVADGVYETLLDGMELEELDEHEGVDVKHYFMVDSHRTWWGMGKSYLCRMVDMIHMGYVDEVLFGYEVVERLPDLASEWVAAATASGRTP